MTVFRQKSNLLVFPENIINIQSKRKAAAVSFCLSFICSVFYDSVNKVWTRAASHLYLFLPLEKTQTSKKHVIFVDVMLKKLYNQLKRNWIQQTGCVGEDKLSFDSLVYVVNFAFIYFLTSLQI